MLLNSKGQEVIIQGSRVVKSAILSVIGMYKKKILIQLQFFQMDHCLWDKSFKKVPIFASAISVTEANNIWQIL